MKCFSVIKLLPTFLDKEELSIEEQLNKNEKF